MDRQNRYDAYPYPQRDPAEETSRLLTGSPSDIREIDHYVFAGRRDWSRPFRVLVAGGGTGDALVMMAQQLADAAVPHEIVYLDGSVASRDIAAARLKARGLANVEFLVGDILDPPGEGLFDYIDCCGVLHHLADPAEGAAALASRLAPDGGMGIMVYAPLGRTGVYPLQSAFSRLFGDLPYDRQIASARSVLDHLPKTNWILRNPFVGDHKSGDAGFFDLLLHDRDRPFWADEIAALLTGAGLDVSAYIAPICYEPERYLPRTAEIAEAVGGLGLAERARLAEELCGSMKLHILYATAARGAGTAETSADPQLTLHLNGVDPARIAAHVGAGRPLGVTVNGHRFERLMDSRGAGVLSAIDGRATVAGLLEGAGLGDGDAAAIVADLEFLIAAGLARCSSLPPQRR